MVSHRNLMSQCRGLGAGAGYGIDSVAVNWMPHFHDYGLVQGLLVPLFSGIPCVFLAPVAFLRKPIRWLRALSDYRGTHSQAPNFAYDYCARNVNPTKCEGLDLSAWIAAGIAAEPIHDETIRRFSAAFEPYGFRPAAFAPGYGLAETTLAVSSCAPGDGASIHTFGARRLVGCGRLIEGMRAVIVDPDTLTVCSPGEVGEIWISGSSVAQGYWNRPLETKEAFQAFLRDTGEGPFLRTGDLGAFRASELVVAGRIKDLIIVAGENRYPQDLERTVEACHPLVRSNGCAAFSLEIEGEERVAIAAELKGLSEEPRDVIDRIRLAAAEEHDVDVHTVILLRSGGLPRTSSGKVQRNACRLEYLTGALDALAVDSRAAPQAALAEVEVSDWLRNRIAALVGLDPTSVDPDVPFAALGLVSRHAVQLAGELEERIGHAISPVLFYEFPTVGALSRFLSRQTSNEPASWKKGTVAAEPVAIVGMACRFPGAVSVGSFRELLWSGQCAVGRSERRNAPGFALLDEVDRFDAPFFGIAPQEACYIDPQQRLLLELAWEALEDAGLPFASLAGSRTAVMLGLANSDYGWLQFRDDADASAFTATGSALSIAASRIAYYFDFRGPATVVDTACSSSLVAVHQACQSLRSGECEAALAGGANLILTPEWTAALSQAGMMSPDGLCRTFDAGANGYVRGEGVGIVVLKRLSEAQQAGDRILGVILGSAVNQDGRSNGLTAPSPAAQRDVIRTALQMAQVEPWEVQYVEAHGTGTKLGDPIEVQALNGVLGEGRKKEKALRIGSVKTNIGHLEAAAGIAGLIKVVLALGEEKIPPQLHFVEPNPHIEWERMAVEVVTEATPWHAGRRVAGVSSFGFGGTNAHVVLERGPEGEKRERQEAEAGEGVLSEGVLRISARTPEALRELTGRYAAYLETTAEGWLDICSTAENGRARFERQLAVRASSVAEARRKLLNGEIEPAGTDTQGAGVQGLKARSAWGEGKRSPCRCIRFSGSGIGFRKESGEKGRGWERGSRPRGARRCSKAG